MLVAIEEKDLAAWGWPFPDARIAEILNAIQQSSPAAIGLDIYRGKRVGTRSEYQRKVFEDTGPIAVSKLGPTDGLTVAPPPTSWEQNATGSPTFLWIPMGS